MNMLLRTAYNACSFAEPLEADDPRRVDLYAMGVRGSGKDPITRLQTVIETANNPTQQLFSGFMGSGKSTELKRLASNLKESGYIPILAQFEDFFNLTVPPGINDVLATAAASVDRYIQENCTDLVDGFKSYWERFSRFLGSEVTIDSLTLKIPDAAELSLRLKEDVGFKTKLYSHLEQGGRLADLAKQCNEYLDEASAVIRKSCPGSKELVIIIDSFEKVRGDFRHAEEVRQAIENIFIRDRKLLCLPCHVIYTVPPWLTSLTFGVAPELGKVTILPMCRLSNPAGIRVPEGFEAMRWILRKRMDVGLVFSSMEPLDAIIEASGGYPRDFLRMMQEVILSAIMEKIAPPIPADDLSRIAADIIRDQIGVYDKPVYDEDLPLLVEVANTHDLPRKTRDEVFRTAELFDNHFILCYRNGEEWYDLHPLVRRGSKVKTAIEKATLENTDG